MVSSVGKGRIHHHILKNTTIQGKGGGGGCGKDDSNANRSTDEGYIESGERIHQEIIIQSLERAEEGTHGG